MLCTWAAEHDVSGVGADISEVFLAAGRQRIEELNVGGRVMLVHGDAARYVADSDDRFDIVSCIGATWIGGGLVGTLELMRPRVVPTGLVLVGVPYWVDPPPAEPSVVSVIDGEFESLAGTLGRFDHAGFELVEMVLASPDDWDRYVAAQWMTVADWLTENPHDSDADELREWIRAGQPSYLGVTDRRCLGWGVFVLRDRIRR